MFREGLSGTIRFCIATIIVLFLFLVIVQKCQSCESIYFVDYTITMTDGQQDQEKIDKLFQAIKDDFLSTHYHSGEINFQLTRVEGGVLIKVFCSCQIKEASNESDYLYKLFSKNWLSSSNTS